MKQMYHKEYPWIYDFPIRINNDYDYYEELYKRFDAYIKVLESKIQTNGLDKKYSGKYKRKYLSYQTITKRI